MIGSSHQTAIKIDNVSKIFHVGVQDVQILKDITLEIKSGDFAVIFGPSGCGKSTLLNVILGLRVILRWFFSYFSLIFRANMR
ncbi:ATP-binding cassette domain-containing protein [Patescibacteria group bacterium]|nr:ATP-binding cassette domain-containing protein [Patescibacteria group bacterium]